LKDVAFLINSEKSNSYLNIFSIGLYSKDSKQTSDVVNDLNLPFYM